MRLLNGRRPWFSAQAFMDERKRLRVVASGIVQGVCFRYYAKRRADELHLTGWVRNLPTGQVEAVFEGAAPDVDAMEAWFRHGPPGAHVRELAVEELPPTGGFDGFRITF